MSGPNQNPPEFTLLRSDTQGVVDASFENDDDNNTNIDSSISEKEPQPKRSSRFFKGLKLRTSHDNLGQGSPPPPARSPSPSSSVSALSPTAAEATSPRKRRLSNIFRSRSQSSTHRGENVSSLYVPEGFSSAALGSSSDLSDGPADEKTDLQHSDSPDQQLHQIEQQAEALALANSASLKTPQSIDSSQLFSKQVDEKLQKAIDLHEQGKLDHATSEFKALADPNTINHPLAQVLYGLSLRHGWGCAKEEQKGFEYLRIAASNSALIDQLEDSSGASTKLSRNSKKGLAKGELILAIYELGNCFRYGWGCEKDHYAAKTYYETAANLGDVDAMIEVAWCYYSGFGTKKDKHTSARYYRRAEKAGRSEVGNSWIWKNKYD